MLNNPVTTRVIAPRSAARVAPAARRSMDAPLTAAIGAANDAYLADLIAKADRVGSGASTLPPAIVAGLRMLDRTERRHIAAMPFTLFSLRFSDAAYWRSLIEQSVDRPRRPLAGESATRTAVFLAWHLAQLGPSTVGLAMGMSAEVAALYRWLPLGELDRIGGLAASAITPRWPQTSSFWRRLLSAAQSTDAVDRARFFGLQLLAAECLPATRPRIAGPSVHDRSAAYS